MSAGSFLDVCGFNPVSAGLGDFVVNAAIQGYLTPAGAGAGNTVVYSYRAENSSKTEWENGFGAYTVGSVTLARSTIVFSSTGAKVNFTAQPNVYITALTADLVNAALLSAGLLPDARLNNTITAAGPVGDSTHVPAVTFDAHGRLTTVSSVAIAFPSNAGVLISVVAYSSTQTITIPTGATKAFIQMVGGCGGGAGTPGAGSGQAGTGGSGSGGVEKYLTGLTPGNTLSYTKGAGGTAGAATPTAGGAGGNSTLASGTQTITTLTASGGAGGSHLTGPGAAGTGTNGDRNITGQIGQSTGMDNGNTPYYHGIGGMAAFGVGCGGDAIAGSAGVAGTAGNLIIEWYA